MYDRILLSYGADPLIRDHQNRLPIHVACQKKGTSRDRQKIIAMLEVGR